MFTNNTKTAIQHFIIQTMVMKLSEKESLEYLKDKGFSISHDTYYRMPMDDVCVDCQHKRENHMSFHDRTDFDFLDCNCHEFR